MYLTVTAVLYQDALAGTIGRVLIRPSTLTTLQHHSIVVHMHEASLYMHIGTGINVNGIRRRSATPRLLVPDTLGGGIDETVQETHVMTLVDMVRPESTVDQTDVLNGHMT